MSVRLYFITQRYHTRTEGAKMMAIGVVAAADIAAAVAAVPPGALLDAEWHADPPEFQDLGDLTPGNPAPCFLAIR